MLTMFNETHKANLLKLADGLEQHTFPNEFGMGTYVYYVSSFAHAHMADDAQCGTVCCALGTATAIVERRLAGEPWHKYAHRVFGIVVTLAEYDWLFSGDWVYTDDTPEGAAKRIRWMLEHGVPDDWCAQMNGLATLCYN